MTKTERLINRIKEVENFENVAWVCKNFSDFCDEVLEWGVDHAAGVDFDDPDPDDIVIAPPEPEPEPAFIVILLPIPSVFPDLILKSPPLPEVLEPV